MNTPYQYFDTLNYASGLRHYAHMMQNLRCIVRVKQPLFMQTELVCKA